MLWATPSTIAWGTFMLNFCFSVLLLWGAVMTILASFRWAKRDGLTRCSVWGMGLFWVVNASYHVLFPMPLPAPLQVLGWSLFGFAAIVALLYGMAIVVDLLFSYSSVRLARKQGAIKG